MNYFVTNLILFPVVDVQSTPGWIKKKIMLPPLRWDMREGKAFSANTTWACEGGDFQRNVSSALTTHILKSYLCSRISLSARSRISAMKLRPVNCREGTSSCCWWWWRETLRPACRANLGILFRMAPCPVRCSMIIDYVSWLCDVITLAP